MRALVFKDGLHYEEGYPTPLFCKGEALIRVICSGICRTDIEIIKGYMGFQGILGHEFVGIVEECFEKELVGKRVVGEINIGCDACSYCQKGMKNHCPNRSVLGILNKDGAFAEYLTLPVSNLHIVSDSISDEEAAFVEPLAAAFEITEQVDIGSHDNVCVLGDGRLGLLIGQVLQMKGCRLVVVGKHQNKLSILDRMGIETMLGPISKERVFDIVVDSTGSPSGLEMAFDIVKPVGKVIIKTTVEESRAVDLNRVVIDELTLVGSRCGPFPPAIRALQTGSVDVAPLISRVFPIEGAIGAFQYASGKGVLKVILNIA